MSGQNIGWAVERLIKGDRVRRAGWNGKGMFLVYVPGTPGVELKPGTAYDTALRIHRDAPERAVMRVTINPHIDMYTAQGDMQPGWLCSMTDMLAEDWELA